MDKTIRANGKTIRAIDDILQTKDDIILEHESHWPNVPVQERRRLV